MGLGTLRSPAEGAEGSVCALIEIDREVWASNHRLRDPAPDEDIRLPVFCAV